MVGLHNPLLLFACFVTYTFCKYLLTPYVCNVPLPSPCQTARPWNIARMHWHQINLNPLSVISLLFGSTYRSCLHGCHGRLQGSCLHCLAPSVRANGFQVLKQLHHGLQKSEKIRLSAPQNQTMRLWLWQTNLICPACRVPGNILAGEHSLHKNLWIPGMMEIQNESTNSSIPYHQPEHFSIASNITSLSISSSDSNTINCGFGRIWSGVLGCFGGTKGFWFQAP